jgi:HEAT repeat protein
MYLQYAQAFTRGLAWVLIVALAAPALSSAGDNDAQAIAAHIDALRSEHPLVRKRAALALGRVGPEAREAIPALEKLLSDPDRGVQDAAAHALEAIDPDKPGMLPAVKSEAAIDAQDGARKIRLIYFDSVTDSIMTQQPEETDEAFTERLRLHLQNHEIAPSSVTEELRNQRQEIEAAWPTTQAATELKILRKEKEIAERDVDRAEVEVAQWEVEVANYPKLLTAPIALSSYKAMLSKFQTRLRVLDTRITQLQQKSPELLQGYPEQAPDAAAGPGNMLRARPPALGAAAEPLPPDVARLFDKLLNHATAKPARIEAAQELARRNPPATLVPQLVGLLEDTQQEWDLRCAVASVLGAMGPEDQAVVLALQAFFKALSTIGPEAEAAVPLLVKLLNGKPPVAKGPVSHPRQTPQPQSDLGVTAAAAIGQIGSRKAVDALRDIVKFGNDPAVQAPPAVQQAARQALVQMAQGHPKREVQQAATKALADVDRK